MANTIMIANYIYEYENGLPSFFHHFEYTPKPSINARRIFPNIRLYCLI